MPEQETNEKTKAMVEAGKGYRFQCGICKKDVGQTNPPHTQWMQRKTERMNPFQPVEVEAVNVQICNECKAKT